MATQIPNRLCKVCSKCFDTPRRSRIHGRHHRDYAALEAAADANCYVCGRVRNSIERLSKSASEKGSIGRSHFYIDRTEDPATVANTLRISTHIANVTVDFKLAVLEKSVWERAKFQDMALPSTRSQHRLDLIRTWIQSCNVNHTKCQTLRSTNRMSQLPSRLLQLNESFGATESKVTLCYADTVAPDVQYLSLSHAWGNERFLTLSKENHDAFLQNIPVLSLLKSFQDAIYVTRSLGVRYLWIDSLCIIQDDPGDWAKESKRMADVYKNAVVNLSASDFDSGVDGFLLDRRSADPVPVAVHLHGNSTEKRFFISEYSPWHSLWNGPLFNRAWVLQEQILAPRAVHFGREQFHWECQELYANEAMPLGLSVLSLLGGEEYKTPECWNPSSRHYRLCYPFYERFDLQLSGRRFWHFSIDGRELDGALDTIWMDIIDNYSSRQLTVITDRLPALAGLISEFARVLHVEVSTCMYGIWKHDLLRQLLWTQRHRHRNPPMQPPTTKPDWSLQPSWSWVSLHAPIGWDNIICSHLEIKYDIWPISSILDGKVNAAPPDYALHIQGNPFKFAHDCRTYFMFSFIGTSKTPVTKIFGIECLLQFDAWYKHCMHDSAESDPLVRHQSLLQGILVLPLVQWRHLLDIGVFGLALTRDKSLGKGVYRRVGKVKMTPRFDHKKTTIDKMKAHREELEDDEVVERCEDGTVVLCLH